MSKRFITAPNDVFTIITHEGVISDGIEVKITNDVTKEEFTIVLSNNKKAWQLLKDLDEMPARAVYVEHQKWEGPAEVVEFKKSAPYKYRFG